MIYRILYINSGGCLGFLNHQQYYPAHTLGGYVRLACGSRISSCSFVVQETLTESVAIYFLYGRGDQPPFPCRSMTGPRMTAGDVEDFFSEPIMTASKSPC